MSNRIKYHLHNFTQQRFGLKDHGLSAQQKALFVSCDFMGIPQLIKHLNDDILQLADRNYFLNQLDREAIQSRWMGYPPASLPAIIQKEFQLGTVLPRSYKNFLLTSNGFRHVSPSVYELYSIEKIDWTRDIEDHSWLNGIESDSAEVSNKDYADYSKTQRPEWFRAEYFRDSLKISDWGDACCLFLNPKIKHHGEWEVLFYATWWPGTRRYRSFEEYLLETHETNSSLLTSLKQNRS